MSYDKKAVRDFCDRWRDKGYEKGETQQFWLQALRAIGYQHADDVLFEHHLPSGGFIDVWIRDANVLIEQKSYGANLDDYDVRQNKKKTPLMQALDYVDELPRLEQPRFVVTCNFGEFRVYDRDKWSKSQLSDNAFEFTLDEFAEHPEYMSFITDPGNSRLEKEKQVSIKAGELIGRLYDMMREGYYDPDSEKSMHALNVLCVRLVFCLYCEDADLFVKDSFFNYLQNVPANQLRIALKRLFKALDTNLNDRDPYDVDVKIFPYVNGGLFREETEIPIFTEEAKQFLLEEVSAAIDWSQISPTIFGGIFESTLNPETRRSGGMHYTSPENIHKVIDPLFLDDLKREFAAIRDEEGLTPRRKKSALARFHAKLCSLKFFDPACGSGNFLTETYICLRKLEDAVLSELQQGQSGFVFTNDEELGKRISLNQFYGIEINDFAVTVAESALWISRLKANGENFMFYEVGDDDFPLRESAHIVEGNALRLDWNEILAAEQCSFIMGNPPFVGARQQTPAQKNDLVSVFEGMKGTGNLDYVAGWYVKTAKFISNLPIKAALVSTNSICQGEQPSLLWKPLFKEGIKINFAHDTFRWTSEASEKAHVYVVIIGFSKIDSARVIYHYPNVDALPQRICVKNINGYLMDAPSIFVESISKPISKEVRPINYGSFALDDGSYTISEKERNELLKHDSEIDSFLRPFLGANEIIKGINRWCLWFQDANEEEVFKHPLLADKVEHVRTWRAASNRGNTAELSKTPLKFAEIRQPNCNYLAVPTVCGEKRMYIPMTFLNVEVIASNQIYVLPGASLYDFGILMSQFHNAWMRAVAGRLESRYRYAAAIVYNTFIWPEPTDEQRRAIEVAGQAVLDARANHGGCSLAQMYDGISPLPENPSTSDLKKYNQSKYDDLLTAHKTLDAVVEAAYGVDFKRDEEKIVTHLFKLYAEKTKQQNSN